MRRIAIRAQEPARNVGADRPNPKWWVFDTLLGERDGWIVNVPSGGFICYMNTGVRFSETNSLTKALEMFG